MSNLHVEEARANALELRVATLQQRLDELATDYQATMRRAVAEKDEAERRLVEAERRAEYWKAEHLAGNRAIEQAERAGMERAAKVCEDVADKCQERDYFKCVEMKQDAESGANDCAAAIRALIPKDAGVLQEAQETLKQVTESNERLKERLNELKEADRG